MREDAVRAAITPLRMIFWGGLVCLVDVSTSTTINGEGTRFDFVSDVVGTLLIAFATFRLCKVDIHERYMQWMGLVYGVALFAVLDAIRAHIITPLPAFVSLMLYLFGIVELAAIIAFTVALRWFCETVDLQDAAQSWRTTTRLFLFVYAIPLGILHLAMGIALVMGESIDVDLGPIELLLLPIFAAPVVHLFISTSRMKGGAEASQRVDRVIPQVRRIR